MAFYHQIEFPGVDIKKLNTGVYYFDENDPKQGVYYFYRPEEQQIMLGPPDDPGDGYCTAMKRCVAK